MNTLDNYVYEITLNFVSGFISLLRFTNIFSIGLTALFIVFDNQKNDIDFIDITIQTMNTIEKNRKNRKTN